MHSEHSHTGNDETVHVIEMKAKRSPRRYDDSHEEDDLPPPLRENHGDEQQHRNSHSENR